MYYRIRVLGHLSQTFQDRFAGLSIEQQETGTTLLVGTLPDQAELYGVLLQLIRLGLTLLSLETSQTTKKKKEQEPPATILSKEQLEHGYLFQGKDYEGIPLSFFWMQLPPDEGPRLHFHPYAEIFVILEGQATFTVGESTREIAAGTIVIGPANVPHKFSQAGEENLKIVTIHPSPKTIGTRIED